MAILRIEVCQVCQEIGKPIKRYRIGTLEELNRIPLCDDCLQRPFKEIFDARPRRAPRAPNRPVTMEDVAAAKKRAAASRKRKPRVARKHG